MPTVLSSTLTIQQLIAGQMITTIRRDIGIVMATFYTLTNMKHNKAIVRIEEMQYVIQMMVIC